MPLGGKSREGFVIDREAADAGQALCQLLLFDGVGLCEELLDAADDFVLFFYRSEL
ncbi:hypothetical protein KCP73_08735 [Salmonella enterica subsp. enterica]|nr:hypothetical protein KCP73_08735 [Salmonella enterica subsp. enterica]